jgi:GNAT superfamily N-acetyltransferase
VTASRVTIRDARPAEREALEELQRRASVHEPMYREQLAAHPEAIELPAEQIADGLVRVAEQEGVLVGFAVLFERAGEACELDGLFVEPGRMRGGIGRLLVQDAARIGRDRGAARIDVIANPQAGRVLRGSRIRDDGRGADPVRARAAHVTRRRAGARRAGRGRAAQLRSPWRRGPRPAGRAVPRRTRPRR